jgi:hypothetical protein
MRHAIAPLTLALAALLNGAPSWAGAAAGSFAVSITLNTVNAPQPAAPVCFTRTLKGFTRAGVAVACSSKQVVNIEALPGVRFVGPQSGAFRYVVPFVSQGSSWDVGPIAGIAWPAGQGTVTMLQVYDLTRPEGPGNVWWDRLLEMRVSF